MLVQPLCNFLATNAPESVARNIAGVPNVRQHKKTKQKITYTN